MIDSSKPTRRRFLVRAACSTAVVAGLQGARLFPAAQAASVTLTARGPQPVTMTLNVNGRAHTLALEPRVTLLDALRERGARTVSLDIHDRKLAGVTIDDYVALVHRVDVFLPSTQDVGEYLPGWHRYEDYRASYAARADLGGGVVLTQIHEYDYLCALFGVPERLFALGGHWSNLELDVEDTASVLMQCRVSGRPLPVHLAQDYVQQPASRTCEAVGDRGKAVLDFAGRCVELRLGGGEPTIERLESFDRNELYLREMRHFLDCVAKGKRPSVDLREGRKSLEIALAVKRSIATGTVVDVAEAHVA